jgi:phosphopantetheine adenylyltransferase
MVARKTLSDVMQPFAQRKHAVEAFCEACRPGFPVTVVEINDPVGPAGTHGELNALVLSPDSLAGIVAVDQTRLTNGLQPVRPLIIPLLPSVSKLGVEAASPDEVLADKMSSTEGRITSLAKYKVLHEKNISPFQLFPPFFSFHQPVVGAPRKPHRTLP